MSESGAPASPWWAPENLGATAEDDEGAPAEAEQSLTEELLGERPDAEQAEADEADADQAETEHAEAETETDQTAPPQPAAGPPAAPPPPGRLVAGPGVPPAGPQRAEPGRLHPQAAAREVSDTLPDGVPPVQPAPPTTSAAPPPWSAARPSAAAPGPPDAPRVTMPMAAPVPGAPAGERGPVMAPAYRAGASAPPYAGTAPPGTAEPRFGGRRPILLVAGGAVAAVVIGIVGFTTLSGSSEPKPAAQSAAPSRGAAPPPPSRATPKGNAGAAPSIDNEKTDRRPLRLSEVFPARPISLGGRVFGQDKTSVNHDCTLVARGAMAEALVRGRCRGVVRATYVDTKKRLAVTAGVVAMPTRRLAVAARRAGDPGQYEWFRGMPGKVARNIDQAGGYAASTIRGRYIIYSYTTYLDGHVSPGDRLLATVGRQFVGYAVRPIERRSR